MEKEVARSLYPADGHWTRAADWEAVAAHADRIDAWLRPHLLRRLRGAFPVDWVKSDDMHRHPVTYAQITRPGRMYLLEFAYALAALGADGKTIKRLRHPKQYSGAASEFLVGLFLVACGATLTPAPPSPKTRKRCEWIATMSSGEQFAVEVKRVEQSEKHKDLLCAEIHLYMDLMVRVARLLEPRPELRATVRFAPSVREVVERRAAHEEPAVDRERAEALCVEAAALVERALDKDPLPTDISLGAIGDLSLRYAPDDPNRVLQGVFIQPDRRALFRHARRELRKARQQVGGRGFPGIVFLDLDGDGLLVNARDELARWVDSKDELGALVLVDRTALEGRFHTLMTVLPGPRIDEVWPLLEGGLETCDLGHLHYDPVCTLPSPCPFTWLPRAIGP